MKTNKILLGGLAGGVVFFLLGWIVYGVLLMDYSTANTNQCAMIPMEEMHWWAMILSNLAVGFLLSFVFSWSNTNGWMAGAKAGGVIGILYAVAVDFGMYSMTDWFQNIGALVVDVLVYTVLLAVTGIVVALVMGNKKLAKSN